MGLVAPWHVGSSRTRDQTRVPCIGKWILNYCATREVLPTAFDVTGLKLAWGTGAPQLVFRFLTKGISPCIVELVCSWGKASLGFPIPTPY